MPATRKKPRTNSLIAKTESALNAVLDGHRARPSVLPVLPLAKAVRSLLKQNHRLTTSNARLKEEAYMWQQRAQRLDQQLDQALVHSEPRNKRKMRSSLDRFQDYLAVG